MVAHGSGGASPGPWDGGATGGQASRGPGDGGAVGQVMARVVMHSSRATAARGMLQSRDQASACTCFCWRTIKVVPCCCFCQAC